MLWPCGVGVGVVEHVERALALATSIPSPVRLSSSRVMWVRGWVISLSSRVV
jgi:hypothetical protein